MAGVEGAWPPLLQVLAWEIIVASGAQDTTLRCSRETRSVVLCRQVCGLCSGDTIHSTTHLTFLSLSHPILSLTAPSFLHSLYARQTQIVMWKQCSCHAIVVWRNTFLFLQLHTILYSFLNEISTYWNFKVKLIIFLLILAEVFC